MKNMIILLLVLLPVKRMDEARLQGKWKLIAADSFEGIMSSSRFQLEEVETKLKFMDTYQKVLDNTYYEFRGDSVFFTNVTPDNILDKVGRWQLDADTLFINDLEKIQTYKFLIQSVTEKEMELKFILPRIGVSKNSMKFKRAGEH